MWGPIYFNVVARPDPPIQIHTQFCSASFQKHSGVKYTKCWMSDKKKLFENMSKFPKTLCLTRSQYTVHLTCYIPIFSILTSSLCLSQIHKHSYTHGHQKMCHANFFTERFKDWEQQMIEGMLLGCYSKEEVTTFFFVYRDLCRDGSLPSSSLTAAANGITLYNNRHTITASVHV